MLKTLGIVQACFHAPHFRANAMRKLGGCSLFEWVIRRVTDAMRLDGVIVVALLGLQKLSGGLVDESDAIEPLYMERSQAASQQ